MALTAAELRAVYSVDEGPLKRSLAGLPGRVDATTGQMAGSASRLGLALAAGVGMIGAGIGAAGALGVTTAAKMETANIAFTTMLGSAQKADAFLRQLQVFAAKTPFEFPELQTAASSLISVGISADKVIPIMTTLGNVTSGMGTGSEGIRRATVALQQMTAAGKIQAEDLNQLRDAGVPVYDLLSAALGKTKAEVADLAQKGKLGQDALNSMMTTLQSGAGLERFAGLMDKQSASLSGLTATFKDAVSMGLANAVQPLIPMLKEGLTSATAFAEAAIPALVRGFALLVAGAGAVAGALMAMGRWIGDNKTSIMIVAGIITTIFLPALINMAVQSTISAATTAAAWVTTQAAAAASAAGMWVSVARTVAGWVLMAAQATINGIKVAAVWTAQVVASAVSGAVAFGVQVARVVAGWVLMGVQAMAQAARMAAAWLIAMGPVGWVIAAVIGLVALIIANWDKVKTFTVNAWNAVTGFVSGAWRNITSAVSSGVNTAVDWVRGLPGRILGALGNLGSLLLDAGASVIRGFVNGLKNAFGWVKDTLGNLTSKLTSWKGPPGRDAKILQNAGRLVIGGFIGGMESQYVAARRSLEGFTGSLAVAGTAPGTLTARRPAGAYTGSGTAGGAGGGAQGGPAPVTGPLVNIEQYVEQPGSSPQANANALAVEVRTRPWT